RQRVAPVEGRCEWGVEIRGKSDAVLHRDPQVVDTLDSLRVMLDDVRRHLVLPRGVGGCHSHRSRTVGSRPMPAVPVPVRQRLLEGRVALVTGAGRGIGRGIARALAAGGAQVMSVARTETELDSLQAEIGGAYLA